MPLILNSTERDIGHLEPNTISILMIRVVAREVRLDAWAWTINLYISNSCGGNMNLARHPIFSGKKIVVVREKQRKRKKKEKIERPTNV